MQSIKIKSRLEIQRLVGKKFPPIRFLYKTPFMIHANKIDGIPMVCTADLNLNRIKVEVENGVIVKVIGLG